MAFLLCRDVASSQSNGAQPGALLSGIPTISLCKLFFGVMNRELAKPKDGTAMETITLDPKQTLNYQTLLCCSFLFPTPMWNSSGHYKKEGFGWFKVGRG